PAPRSPKPSRHVRTRANRRSRRASRNRRGRTSASDSWSCRNEGVHRSSSDEPRIRCSVLYVAPERSPITGGCLCGRVRYQAEAEPVVQGACHCTDCQRQTGGPFTVIIGVPRDAFTVEGDTLASFNTVGEDHGGETQRNFCSACGAPVFSIAAVAPELALIKAGSLGYAPWLQPNMGGGASAPQPRGARLGARGRLR